VFGLQHLYAQESRQHLLFNNGWKFHKGDVSDGESVNLNDKNWRKLDLPHDWSIEGPFSSEWASGTGYLPGGIGWYRKSFSLPADIGTRKVFIYFDGVYKNSEVWINGHYLGKRPNGYIPFQYELTGHLNKKGENVIAVKVDHTQFADSRWYPGSGIYRNVYLTITQPVHFNLWGVGFTTPEVSESKASAKITAAVKNSTSIQADIIIKSRLIDPEGKTAVIAKKKISLQKNGEAETEFSMAVPNPQLWSPDEPNLYSLNVSLYQKGKKIDEYQTSVGFRNLKFDPDEGFYLNGKNMKLKGVCIHHDAGALGAAVPREVWERRLQKMKDAGCNAIRMSHYPHQDYLYDLCDKMGFLVMDEAFDEWEIGKNK